MSLEESEGQREKPPIVTRVRRIPGWLIWGAAMGVMIGRIGLGIAASAGFNALRASSERRGTRAESGDKKSDRDE